MADQGFRVLLIEDNPGDARLVREAFAEAKGARFELEHVDRLAKGIARLSEGGIDAVLLDLSLPDSFGIATFTTLRESGGGVPTVVLSGSTDESAALVAVQEGAEDYLVKGHVQPALLTRALHFAIERHRAKRARDSSPSGPGGAARKPVPCATCGQPLAPDAAICPSCATPRGSGELAAGAVFAKHYEVIDSIGRGGCGAVYKVRHVLLDQIYALKLLRPDLLADPHQRKRFIREGKLGARFSHPNVVAVREFGIADGVPYMAMDFVQGRTLSEALKEGPLSPSAAVGFAREILRAIGAAHRSGIVHRDLKPANVLLEPLPDGAERVRVLDLGLARVFEDEDGVPKEDSISSGGALVGTVGYMAPEQGRGETVGPRADIYSCGVVLYEMLAGALPFAAAGGSVYETMWQIMTQAAEPPSARRPAAKIPGALDAIVLRAISKAPADRFPSAEEFDVALEGLQSSRIPGLLRGEEPAGMTEEGTRSGFWRSLVAAAKRTFGGGR